MLNLPDAETRRSLALHGAYKADVYKKIGGLMFIESEKLQAEQIATMTGKAFFQRRTLDIGQQRVTYRLLNRATRPADFTQVVVNM